MYKVFINDRIICFTNNAENCEQFSNVLVLNFYSHKVVPFIVHLLKVDPKIQTVVFVVNEYEKAFAEFQSYFKLIKAAGGIVHNNKEERLFIYRLDKWDLPKGKIENDESNEDAAIREIEEECGINDLKINKKLTDTFHIYSLNDQLILKQTFWFDMNSSFDGQLVPEIAEGISDVQWLTENQINSKVKQNTYASIKELLETNVF